MVYGSSMVSGTGSTEKGYRKLNVWHVYTWHYAYPPKLWQLTSCVQRGHVSVYGPNFFRPASINRASAKLENRVTALRNILLLTAAGSFFVLLLTGWSFLLPVTALLFTEDVACYFLPALIWFLPRNQSQPPDIQWLRLIPVVLLFSFLFPCPSVVFDGSGCFRHCPADIP